MIAHPLWAHCHRWTLWFHPARHTSSPSLVGHVSHFYMSKHRHTNTLNAVYIKILHIICMTVKNWVSHLGCFIHPSKRTCPLASLTCSAGEFAFSRHNASEKWVAYSAGRPQVAGRHGEHLGWHRVWHSAIRQDRARGRMKSNFKFIKQ